MLVDAEPLVAMIDADDPYHAKCATMVRRLPRTPLLTTWPCFTEAMYLLYRGGGHPSQEKLWIARSRNAIGLHDASDVEIVRMRELMQKYRDRPMDLGDASLVAAAEALIIKTIFTLDRDFLVYRLADNSTLTLVP